MSYEGYLEFGGKELANHARTIALARSMGVHSIRLHSSKVAWIEAANKAHDIAMLRAQPSGIPVSVETYRNLIVNPSFEKDLGGWRGFSGHVLARIAAADARAGGYVGTTTTPTTGGPFLGVSVGAIAAQPGQRHSSGFWVKGPAGRQARVRSTYRTPDNAAISGADTFGATVTLTGDWQRLTHTPAVAPAGTALFDVGVGGTGTWAAGEALTVDAAICVLGTTLPTYFDGDTPDGDVTVDPNALITKWLGTPHNSVSVQGRWVWGREHATISTAPWYDAGVPESSEFAGVIVLSAAGLDDSSLTASPSEYTGDGGTLGRVRSGTQALVFDVVLMASTERGLAYGYRWLKRQLAMRNGRACNGSELEYYEYNPVTATTPPRWHRRNVGLTRAPSVTRKKVSGNSASQRVTFTLTAADAYEYGDQKVQGVLGAAAGATGSQIVSSGSVNLVQTGCPVFDYSPVYDPLNPALVDPPTAPNFLPSGWTIADGQTFMRRWAKISAVEPSMTVHAPVFTVTTDFEARMLRLSIWPSDSDTSDQCDPLFSVVIAYLPVGQTLYIDTEAKAAYFWDGFSPNVQRADTLLYGPGAGPVEWDTFNDSGSLLVTLDAFSTSGASASEADFQGRGTVRAQLALVPKSD